jgi:penicillin-binding protein 1C
VARERLRPPGYESLTLVDRHGLPLGEALTAEAASATWMPLAELSPDLPAAAVAAEDGRFWSHAGLDPLAVARAALQNLRAGRVVSGASTLTQQVARMILADEASGPPPRSLGQKLREAHLALRLERSFSKAEILEAWLNRVPVGGVARGVTAGAERYFGVHPSRLSLAQAALLVGLPRGPSTLRPDRDLRASRRRRNRVLEALRDDGLLSPTRAAAAMAEPALSASARTRPMRARLGAWVARELAARGLPVTGKVRTTVDHTLEAEIVAIARRHIAPLRTRGVKSAAVVVLDHLTDELLALVGSADETDPRWGQVHAGFALRQPGSALKPFVYLAALRQGRTLASLAADVEQAFPDLVGAYLPENYDHRFHGPVRYREALAQSLNVSAVDVLRDAGLPAAAEVLESAGISTISRLPEHYGLGLTLGSLDVQLVELTEAYAVLARGGLRRPTRILKQEVLFQEHPSEGFRAFDVAHAYLIADALADGQARAPQFGAASVLRTPYWAAVKTGTSKGYRDNFCLGFSRRYTVGVWVGDPEGRPMDQISGVAGAGPIWRAVMDRLHRGVPSARPEPPAGVVRADVCPLSGRRPGPRCAGAKEELFVAGTEPAESCAMHREVRLATLDGLPLGPGCTAPAGPPHLATLYPSPFDLWAVRTGSGVPDAVSAACPQPPPGGTRPRLLAPARFEVVRLDPELPGKMQQIQLLADVGAATASVTFLVDGQPAGDRTGPRSALWTIRPGRHRVAARLDGADVLSEEHVVVVR